jgi:hypothetical protein
MQRVVHLQHRHPAPEGRRHAIAPGDLESGRGVAGHQHPGRTPVFPHRVEIRLYVQLECASGLDLIAGLFQRRLDATVDGLCHPFKDRLEQLPLAAEVVINAADAGAGAGHHVGHRRGGEAPRAEHLGSRVQDPPLRFTGLGPAPCRGPRSCRHDSS